MPQSNLIPRTQNITGVDCTGSDGTANRTYTIPDAGLLSEGISIAINGTALMSSDYLIQYHWRTASNKARLHHVLWYQ